MLQSVNFRHCTSLLTAVSAGFQRRFREFLHLSPAVNNAILATMTHPYFKLLWLPAQLADQQSRLKNLFIAAARDMSAAVPNAAVQTNGEDTDDDYFAFADSADTEASQAASDTTNKCNLEVLQFLDDSKKDLETLNRYPVVKKLFVQHNAVLPSSAPVE